MGAFNWIVIDSACPVCGVTGEIEAQTHIASSYEGDSSGRFSGRTYHMGERMAWWEPEDQRYRSWAEGSDDLHPGSVVEACYSSCKSCGSDLYAVIEFRDLVPFQTQDVGLEDEWPEGFWK